MTTAEIWYRPMPGHGVTERNGKGAPASRRDVEERRRTVRHKVRMRFVVLGLCTEESEGKERIRVNARITSRWLTGRCGARTPRCRAGTLADACISRTPRRRVETRRCTQECVRYDLNCEVISAWLLRSAFARRANSHEVPRAVPGERVTGAAREPRSKTRSGRNASAGRDGVSWRQAPGGKLDWRRSAVNHAS
jgi:hypothetical protein